MSSYNKEHKERFLKFTKELVKRGAYFEFIDELCRFDKFICFAQGHKNGDLFDFYCNHDKNHLLNNKRTPWINYNCFFPSWEDTIKGDEYWFMLKREIGDI